MLRYNFEKVFLAKGINQPYAFLVNGGFSSGFASKVKNNRVKRLELREMEQLCIILNCTPNDFTEWIPDGTHKSDYKHALNDLRISEEYIDLVQTINSIPLSKARKLNEMIQKELEKEE